MIPLSVSEISALDGFCDVQHVQQQQERGILVFEYIKYINIYIWSSTDAPNNYIPLLV